ncbi:hypothetical protein C8J57DRAFT_1465714 [Mycena rebaudengoi]|nr:hypothetical protein C8J57DRAFT_1465714 [Mycena rebaudengoi]
MLVAPSLFPSPPVSTTPPLLRAGALRQVSHCPVSYYFKLSQELTLKHFQVRPSSRFSKTSLQDLVKTQSRLPYRKLQAASSKSKPIVNYSLPLNTDIYFKRGAAKFAPVKSFGQWSLKHPSSIQLLSVASVNGYVVSSAPASLGYQTCRQIQRRGNLHGQPSLPAAANLYFPSCACREVLNALPRPRRSPPRTQELPPPFKVRQCGVLHCTRPGCVLLPFPRCAATARPERLGRVLRGRPAARCCGFTRDFAEYGLCHVKRERIAVMRITFNHVEAPLEAFSAKIRRRL